MRCIYLLLVRQHFHLTQGITACLASFLQQQAHVAGLTLNMEHGRLNIINLLNIFPCLGIVRSLDDTFFRCMQPVQLYLLDGQALTQVGINPLFTATVAYPQATELLRWQQFYVVANGILELQLVHIPMGSTSHIHHHTQMLRGNRSLEANQLVELTRWQQTLLGLLIWIGMQLIIKRFARQVLAFQFTNHLPVLTVFRGLATNAVPLGSQLVIISHHTYHTYTSCFNSHLTTIVVLQPGFLTHQDVLGILTAVDSPFGLFAWQHTILCRHRQKDWRIIVADTIGSQMRSMVVVDSRRSPCRSVQRHIR